MKSGNENVNKKNIKMVFIIDKQKHGGNMYKYLFFTQSIKNKRINAAFMLVLFINIMTACAGGAEMYSVRSVSYGSFSNESNIIYGEDNSFSISGKNFTPPFQLDTWNAKRGMWSYANILDKSQDALEMGAKRVRVKTPYFDEDLYGIMVFSKVDEERAQGPAARSYLITIPKNRVESAAGGRTSVIYEPHKIKGGGEWFSWILWLSDTPFPNLPSSLSSYSQKELESRAIQENFDRVNEQTADENLSSAGSIISTWLYVVAVVGGVGLLVALLADGG